MGPGDEARKIGLRDKIWEWPGDEASKRYLLDLPVCAIWSVDVYKAEVVVKPLFWDEEWE